MDLLFGHVDLLEPALTSFNQTKMSHTADFSDIIFFWQKSLWQQNTQAGPHNSATTAAAVSHINKLCRDKSTPWFFQLDTNKPKNSRSYFTVWSIFQFQVQLVLSSHVYEKYLFFLKTVCRLLDSDPSPIGTPMFMKNTFFLKTVCRLLDSDPDPYLYIICFGTFLDI